MEKEFIKYFEEVLINEYNYPLAAIKTEVRGSFAIFDVIVQKGNAFIQAFEIKSDINLNLEEQSGTYSQLSHSLQEWSAGTPVYIIKVKSLSDWDIYSIDDLHKPLDKKDVLDYQKAVQFFFGLTTKSMDDDFSDIKRKSKICAWGILTYLTLYFLYNIINSLFLVPSRMLRPLTAEHFFLVCILIVLYLLPPLLRLLHTFKRFKAGGFEFEK